MNKTEMHRLADEMDASLWRDLIDPWFPACVNPSGGFWQSYDRKWQRLDASTRGVVFQSRMTWTCATLAAMPGPRQHEFARYARHGAAFLAEHFVDQRTGMVRWRIDWPASQRTEAQACSLAGHAYGAAFAIYALSAAHRSLGDKTALGAAQRAFDWLERHHHDPDHGGYFECVDANGAPVIVKPKLSTSGRRGDEIGTPYGLKSQNTHLHLLEAFSEMVKSSPEPRVVERLREIEAILERRLFVPDGWLHVYALPDWTPVAGLISYGHDIEAVHLLLDAAETLDGTVGSETRRVALALAKYTLEHGFDRKRGGVYLSGNTRGRAVGTSKTWWAQAEALLGFARAAELAGDDAGPYWDAVAATWDWIQRYQIDSDFPGWFEGARQDGSRPVLPDSRDRKGHAWKAAYHETRALTQTARILRRAIP